MGLVVPSSAADTAERRTTARAGDNNDKLVITNPGAASPGEVAAPAGRRVSGRGESSRPVPEHVTTQYQFRGPINGADTCIYRVVGRRDTPMTAAEHFDNAGMVNYAAESGVPTCDEEDAEAAPSPGQVAEAFLRQIPLPPPEPRIAPDGQAITGLAAYLETNGSLAHRVGPSATELGPIVVEASSVYWVDWGDGSPEAGPFAFEGEAYPSGRIYHGYRYRGDYVVTVRQAWTAEWRLGAESGTVDGLVTEASVPVHVDEVQAVIRR
ncbi:MAG TPA: hypothetical protein VGV93_13730 [Acidimicrobiales bacterium]|nr:hypothetical protein [Acidimicrobiales bacterium]